MSSANFAYPPPKPCQNIFSASPLKHDYICFEGFRINWLYWQSFHFFAVFEKIWAKKLCWEMLLYTKAQDDGQKVK
jgi:hypothetical protein